MNAHLFVVNNDTFGIHIQKGFAGVVMSSPKIRRRGSGTVPNSAYYGQLSDLFNIRQGDLAFFYLMYTGSQNLLWPENNFQAGYYGIYRVKSAPFFDDRDIEGEDQFKEQLIFGNPNSQTYKEKVKQGKEPIILPVRMLIEPVENLNYKKHVDDNTAYVDKTDEGQLWTLLFKKIRKAGQARGITPLLPEEASKIARLLFKVNQEELSDRVSLLDEIKICSYPYQPEKFLKLKLASAPNKPGSVWAENMLVTWIMQNIDKNIPVLRDIVGNKDDLEFFGNHIQYGIAGDTVDVLLLHRRIINGVEYRYKATVIEVKKDLITERDVAQALRYTKWIAQLVTFNNITAIQPVVIGKAPGAHQISRIRATIQNLTEKGIRTPIFLEYKLHGQKISFSKLKI